MSISANAPRLTELRISRVGVRNARLGYILKKPFVYAVEDEYFIRPIIYDLREF